MFKATKRLLLTIVCILGLVLVLSSGRNPRVVRASGFVSYDMHYFGDCWYWDSQLGAEIGAAQYYYDHWRHTAADNTERGFEPLAIWYSGVCPDDNIPGSAYSADGWRMVVNSPYDVKVYNQSNQQVYP